MLLQLHQQVVPSGRRFRSSSALSGFVEHIYTTTLLLSHLFQSSSKELLLHLRSPRPIHPQYLHTLSVLVALVPLKNLSKNPQCWLNHGETRTTWNYQDDLELPGRPGTTRTTWSYQEVLELPGRPGATRTSWNYQDSPQLPGRPGATRTSWSYRGTKDQIRGTIKFFPDAAPPRP